MPINPNIALGAQQQQQPVNMLGQMGQMYALRAAKQEFEGSEALRDFYASGGDTATAEGRRALLAANPKLGSQILNQQSEMLARDVKTQADSLKTIKENVGAVNTPEAMAEYLKGAYTTPGGAALAKLIPLDRAISAIPTDPKAFADYKRNFGLTADKLFESADAQLSSRTSLATTGMTTAATMRGQDLLDRRAREELQYLTTENGFYGVNKFDPNSARPVGTAPQPVAPVATPAASTVASGAPSNSLLITGAAPTTTNLNAFTGGSPNQAGPTVANAVAQTAAAAAQPTQLRPVQTPTLTDVDDPNVPGQKLRVDARVYKQGTGLGAPGVLGVARTEKLTPQQTLKLKTEMGSDFKILDNVTAQTNDLLKSIDMLRDPDITKGLKAITGYSGVLTPTFKDASQLAQTRLDNLRGKVIALGKASASMTGAIGSIANQEWKILADQIAAIDPKMGDKALLEQVQLVEDRALGVFERAKEQYGRQYGEYFETIGPQYSTMPKLKPRGVSSSGVDRSNPLLQ